LIGEQLDDLETKARVATDLFEKGAARVKITGTDIEVDWQEYQAVAGPASQRVYVNVSSSASSAASVSSSILQIVRELDQLGVEPSKVPEARAKLRTLEDELRRTNPRWDVLRRILRWALDFGRELFLRVAVVVVEHYFASKFQGS